VRRFERAVRAAHAAKLCVAVDSDATAIRLIPAVDVFGCADIRNLGEVVYVDDACGGGARFGASTPPSATMVSD